MAHVTLYSETHKFCAVTQFQHYNNVSTNSCAYMLNYVQLGHSVFKVSQSGGSNARCCVCMWSVRMAERRPKQQCLIRRGVAHVHLVQPYRSCECLAATQQCLSVTACTDIREHRTVWRRPPVTYLLCEVS